MRGLWGLAGALLAVLSPQYDPFAGARHVPVEGASLAYVEHGTGGTPAVLVHGSGADLRTWGYQLQFLGRTRRTIAYSRRFHHPNAPPASGTPYTAAAHAADLASVVRALAGGRADLVASSYGAVVALMVAADEPSLVRRLVLVEPVAFSLLARGAGSPYRDALDELDRAGRLLAGGDADAALRAFAGTLIGPGAYDLMPATARQMLRDNLPELAAEARAPLVTLEPPFGCLAIARIRAPVLLVQGGASAPFLREMTRQVGQCLKVEPTTIAGAAHAVHAQQVDAFNRLVAEFLDRQ